MLLRTFLHISFLIIFKHYFPFLLTWIYLFFFFLNLLGRQMHARERYREGEVGDIPTLTCTCLVTSFMWVTQLLKPWLVPPKVGINKKLESEDRVGNQSQVQWYGLKVSSSGQLPTHWIFAFYIRLFMFCVFWGYCLISVWFNCSPYWILNTLFCNFGTILYIFNNTRVIKSKK